MEITLASGSAAADSVRTHATVAQRRASSEGSGGELPLLQKVLGALVALLIIVWIVANPASAGDTVHGWITGILTFLRHIA